MCGRYVQTRAGDQPARDFAVQQLLVDTGTTATGHTHDRSPLLLPAHFIDTWLDPTLTGLEQVHGLLHWIPEPHLVPVEVGAAVGNVRNNGPQLIAPIHTD